MPPDPSGGASVAAAYQRVQLEEIRTLYQELDLDLEHYLNLGLEVSERIDSAEEETAAVRRMLSNLGVEPDSAKPERDAGAAAQSPPSMRYRRVEVGNTDDFQRLVEEAEAYLDKMGVDLERDPLIQVIGSTETAGALESYREKYGDISWDRSDYLAVMLAGFVATLLDIFLVRIPGDTKFSGQLHQGSPITKWLKEHSGEVHEHFLERFEKVAKVPYDDVRHPDVAGMDIKTHRLESFGHDPVLGFIFGVLDILGDTGTYIDKHGDMVKIAKAPTDPTSLAEAFLKVFLHLLSDVGTPAGLQPPFFTLLQLVKTESPFVLKEGGEEVSWTNVARYMYVHGYDMRHFVTMGIVPATVEMVIRGWRLCEGYEKSEDPELTKAKTASMLMLGHSIAASGNLIKTGAIYHMNPLALNWSQALWMFPVTFSWISEGTKRDRRINAKLGTEWESIYRSREV
jgi:hypothetical protein